MPQLKAVYDSKDAVPEAQRDLYVTTWKVIREIWGAQKVLFFEINRLWKRP